MKQYADCCMCCYVSTDAQKGIEALLALAVGAADSLPGADLATDSEPESEEDDDDDRFGIANDDDSDEDYEGHERRKRRGRGGRAHATPDKSRSRPGSAHVTPHRRGGPMSPGVRGLSSPSWLGGLGDKTHALMGDGSVDVTYQHLTALATSPGYGGGRGSGFVPSPQHPMPRLRRRKFPPEKSPPLVRCCLIALLGVEFSYPSGSLHERHPVRSPTYMRLYLYPVTCRYPQSRVYLGGGNPWAAPLPPFSPSQRWHMAAPASWQVQRKAPDR
jgi:hypothetical protein